MNGRSIRNNVLYKNLTKFGLFLNLIKNVSFDKKKSIFWSIEVNWLLPSNALNYGN